jgi:hypothetical protein
MKRIDEFNSRLDALMGEFSDLSNEDIADSFEYYAVIARQKNKKI